MVLGQAYQTIVVTHEIPLVLVFGITVTYERPLPDGRGSGRSPDREGGVAPEYEIVLAKRRTWCFFGYRRFPNTDAVGDWPAGACDSRRIFVFARRRYVCLRTAREPASSPVAGI